jgi:hypothetical protein
LVASPSVWQIVSRLASRLISYCWDLDHTLMFERRYEPFFYRPIRGLEGRVSLRGLQIKASVHFMAHESPRLGVSESSLFC